MAERRGNVQFCWILVGKLQFLVAMEEVGMCWKIRFRWEDVGEDHVDWERGNFQDLVEFWCTRAP